MNLDELAYELEQRKATEGKARDERIKAEKAIIEAVGLKEEGTTTTKTDWYKISTTAKLTRKLAVPDDFPDAVYQQIVRVKHELDVTRFKKLATSDPKAYAIACQAVETKPGKPEVKISRIEQQQKEAA